MADSVPIVAGSRCIGAHTVEVTISVSGSSLQHVSVPADVALT